MSIRSPFGRLAVYLILLAGSVVFLFPLLWMISTSLKPVEETMQMPPVWIPSTIQWHNYWDAITYEADKLGYIPFLRYAVNTLYLAVRGEDNSVWLNTWSGAAWQGWTALQSGATIDSPTVTVSNGELFVVVRNIDGTTLWYCRIDLYAKVQSGWTQISGSSPSMPTLTP